MNHWSPPGVCLTDDGHHVLEILHGKHNHLVVAGQDRADGATQVHQPVHLSIRVQKVETGPRGTAQLTPTTHQGRHWAEGLGRKTKGKEKKKERRNKIDFDFNTLFKFAKQTTNEILKKFNRGGIKSRYRAN